MMPPQPVNNDAIVVPMKSGIISVGDNAEVPTAQIKRELSSRTGPVGTDGLRPNLVMQVDEAAVGDYE